MIKFITIDLDGTVLNSQSEISEKNARTIRLCLDRGIKVVLNTGKSKYFVDKLIHEFGLKDPQIILGGPVIIDKDLNNIMAKKIDPEYVKEIISLADQYEILAIIGSTDGFYYYEKWQENLKYTEKTNEKAYHAQSFKKDGIIDSAAFISLTLKEGDFFGKKIRKLLRGQLKIIRAHENFLNILDKDVNKSKALFTVLKMFGLSAKDVLAIGDTEADQDIIEVAGIGVAMGNTPDEIKKIADYIVSDNDSNGFPEAIHKYVLKNNVE